MFLSIERGRLNKKRYLWRTVSALRVVSALIFRFNKPSNRAPASSVVSERERGGEGERERERERGREGERGKGGRERRERRGEMRNIIKWYNLLTNF